MEDAGPLIASELDAGEEGHLVGFVVIGDREDRKCLRFCGADVGAWMQLVIVVIVAEDEHSVSHEHEEHQHR